MMGNIFWMECLCRIRKQISDKFGYSSIPKGETKTDWFRTKYMGAIHAVHGLATAKTKV